MNAIEWCERCLSQAPSWASADYAEWLVLSTPDGDYLGVVCAGGIAEPELLALELEDALACYPSTGVSAGAAARARSASLRASSASRLFSTASPSASWAASFA